MHGIDKHVSGAEIKDIEGRTTDVSTMAPANQVMLQLLARYMYSNQVEVYAQVRTSHLLTTFSIFHVFCVFVLDQSCRSFSDCCGL